jgi:ABC-type cobalamin/Fe3+-siderophores transport system ATPase subunit
MKLQSIDIRHAPPVERFAVTDLSDIVVIAGPNGVGKTRLLRQIIAQLTGGGVNPAFSCIVEATSQSERDAWGKRTLDLRDDQDFARFRSTITTNRKRRLLRSSLVNFESDRTIQNLQPYAFSWDTVDPDEEEVGWNLSVGYMRDRYQDTVQAMFRMIEHQKRSIANRAIRLSREGKTEMSLRFDDPMQPFKEVFERLLAPKQLVDPQPSDQRLQFREGDAVYDFTELSSGEREVVNIAFDFLLRSPEDCIVFFDEPELHLHPELSFRLVQTLQEIGARNQFIFSTHSPDVITASLDRSVVFLAPASAESQDDEPGNQAIVVSESDETNQALRLLGQSIGIIALGRRIVLVEGTESSIDKQTYGSIVRNRWPSLVLVPSGGKHEIEAFESVYRNVLSRSIWGVDFFMLCDGDAQPAASDERTKATAEGRLRTLPRYHIENYFLDEEVWADVFATMEPADSWLRDPQRIGEALREVATELISYSVALTISHQVRLDVGNVNLMPSQCHGKSVSDLTDLIVAQAAEESKRMAVALDQSNLRQATADAYARLETAIADDDATWRIVIPGKPILANFCGRAKIQMGRAKSLYIAEGLNHSRQPFAEIDAIFSGFVATSGE